MRFRIIWLLIPFSLLTIEAGIQCWRRMGIEPSTAPLLNWSGELQTSAPPPFGRALKAYNADRGTEKILDLLDGRSIKVFYFEWDNVEAGPFSAISGHESEICNVAAGFKLLSTGDLRRYDAGTGGILEFRHTALAAANGRTVHVYKMPWLQGLGAWSTESFRSRGLRVRRSFIRHRGAARVLQGGIFGAASEQEAWELFEHEVLKTLQWKVLP